jgi:hypothetical protein
MRVPSLVLQTEPLLPIKYAEHARGLNNLCFSRYGSAGCVSLRQKDAVLLKYGVPKDAVPLVDSRFHQER